MKRLMGSVAYAVMAMLMVWVVLSFIDVNANNLGGGDGGAAWNFFVVFFGGGS